MLENWFIKQNIDNFDKEAKIISNHLIEYLDSKADEISRFINNSIVTKQATLKQMVEEGIDQCEFDDDSYYVSLISKFVCELVNKVFENRKISVIVVMNLLFS